jgi:hypothetical protein
MIYVTKTDGRVQVWLKLALTLINMIAVKLKSNRRDKWKARWTMIAVSKKSSGTTSG